LKVKLFKVIVETLEARGLIMPSDGGKMRRVIKD
jgi:hypothetical protein